MAGERSGGIVIFSGGSAANSLVDVFGSVAKARSSPISYIIPISDNGGSSSELIRVFGGPGIGDVRSRLVRLIPQQPYSKEREAIGRLLSGRLSSTEVDDARKGWNEIVDGTSLLWKGISSAKKELIRSFFNLVNLEILKRSRPPVSTFDFRSASIGNLFLTGARLFSGSFESAVYLLSAVCGIPDEDIKVIPSINSNFSHHIAAELEDGAVINGQNSISHPSQDSLRWHSRTSSKPSTAATPALSALLGAESTSEYQHSHADIPSYFNRSDSTDDHHHEAEDANPPFTLATLRASNIAFTKSAHELDQLPSRISRIHYINSFGQEILPPANPRAMSAITSAQAIIYSIGSLYTSIVPNLVLRGVGDAMRRSTAKLKVLILNGCLDREVGPDLPDRPFTAIDFVNAIVRAGEQSRGVAWSPDLDVSRGESLHPQQVSNLRPVPHRAKSDGLGIIDKSSVGADRPLPSPMLASAMPSRAGSPSTSPERPSPGTPASSATSRSSSMPNPIYKHYVTHIIHLPNGSGAPHVVQENLVIKYGIRCIKVYGRRNETGPGMLYDPKALQGAIEAILGGRQHKSDSTDQGGEDFRPRLMDRERGRRYTVER